MSALSDQQFTPSGEYYEMRAPGPTQGMVQLTSGAAGKTRHGAYTREELETYPQSYRSDPGGNPEMEGVHSPGTTQQGTLLHWADVATRDQGVRQNMARRMAPKMTENLDDSDRFVQEMGQSRASRADMHEIEHVGPSVTWDHPSPVAMGSSEGMYWAEDNEIGLKPHADADTLYHELGHALHMHSGKEHFRSAMLHRDGNASAGLEGPADGFMDRLSPTTPVSSYRDSHQYSGPWGEGGRKMYEETRASWAQPDGGQALSLQHKEILAPKLQQGQFLIANHIDRSDHDRDTDPIRRGQQGSLF
jgi:hypothetical protein